MFATWGRMVCRRRWAILAGGIAALVLSVLALVRGGVLSSGVIDGIGLWRWGIFRPSDAPHDLHLALATALAGDGALPELAEAQVIDEALVFQDQIVKCVEVAGARSLQPVVVRCHPAIQAATGRQCQIRRRWSCLCDVTLMCASMRL